MPASRRSTGFQPDRLGELAAAVADHHDLVAGAVLLAPGVHHKRVIDGEAGDRVDALGLQRGFNEFCT